MSPSKPLHPPLGRRQAQQHARFKRLHLVTLGILQRLSSPVDIPARGDVDTDHGDGVTGDVVQDGIVRRADGRVEREP
jgi:hypothetical protein